MSDLLVFSLSAKLFHIISMNEAKQEHVLLFAIPATIATMTFCVMKQFQIYIYIFPSWHMRDLFPIYISFILQ